MRAVAAAIASGFGLLSGGQAVACSCAIPRDLTTPEQIMSDRLARATNVATVRVLDLHLATGQGDPLARSTAEVVRVVKGQAPGRVELRTYGGEEGANCGSASKLFEAASEARLLTVELLGGQGEDAYWIGFCGYYDRGAFGSAEQR